MSGTGRDEIDARGKLVTPGFVDIHTHYDGQASWDTRMQPSSWHGVTTAVMGNCGVGFAPVHARHRDRLVELMEGVEDIPGTALHEGLGCIEMWRDFPQKLCDATRCAGIVYDRTGYGRSSAWPSDPGVRYMEIEADLVLPRLLAALAAQPNAVLAAMQPIGKKIKHHQVNQQADKRAIGHAGPQLV